MKAKPAFELLQDFTIVLHEKNPMMITLDSHREYENEALSILSRFTEAAIHLADDEAIVAQLATAIVKQAFEFWFNDIGTYDAEPLARELIAVYRKAYRVTENSVNHDQFVTEPRVESITIGG